MTSIQRIPQRSQIEAVLSALAVLGEADAETLGLLLEQSLDDALITQIATQPNVTLHGRAWAMAADAASIHLKALEERDFLHFRLLHQRAALLLAQRLSAGEARSEAAFMAVFTRLAEHLRHQDPTGLSALIDAVKEAPLQVRQNEHYRTYIHGIGLQQTGHFDALLALCNSLLAQDDLELALRGRTHNLRATSTYFLGRLQQALDDYRVCLAIMQQIGNKLSAGIVLQNMGALAYDLHDYNEAEARFVQAAAIFAAENSVEWMAAVQNELGLVYRDQGKWAEASLCFERFIAKSDEHGAQDDVAIGLLNLGETLFFQGHLPAAEIKLRATLERMSTDAFRIDVLITLGMIRQIADDLATARDFYQEALALTTRLGRRFMLAAVHFRLASVNEQEGDGAGVLRHLVAGIDVVEETRAPLREEGLKISLLGRWQQLYEETVLHLVGQRRFGEALHYAERARSRTFLDMLASVSPMDDAETSVILAEEPLTLAALQAQLPENAVLVEFFVTGLPGALAPMLANIPQEAQFLLDYLLTTERLLVFIVTREAIEVVELEASVRQIGAQHFQRVDGRLRGTQPVPGQPLRPLNRWKELASRLLLPLQPYVSGKDHLYFVPHGVLHHLPLHALMDIEALTGVANSTVSYGPSASILFKRPAATLDQRVERRDLRAVAIGVNGTDLRHAEDEAAWLGARLQGDLLLGPNATRLAVEKVLPDYAVIHFSCHGHFRQRNALESALALTDGELTALDLLRVGRIPAELVTLSACDTGLNQLHPGDELMGLTRAFLGCGTGALLVTLWPVHEIPTRIFFEHFYQAWMGGASKARAVVEAQRYLVEMEVDALQAQLGEYGLDSDTILETVARLQTMLPGAHPFDHAYYWGAFILIGDPN